MLTMSAPKLIRIALSGQHMPYCPHPKKGKGVDCQCWQFAANKWSEEQKTKRSLRIRTPKIGKMHSARIVCGSKNVQRVTKDDSQVNCNHCKRIMTNPPKRRNAKNSQVSNQYVN